MAKKRNVSRILLSSCSAFAFLCAVGGDAAYAQYTERQPSVEIYLEALDKFRPAGTPPSGAAPAVIPQAQPPQSAVDIMPQRPAYAPPAAPAPSYVPSYTTPPVVAAAKPYKPARPAVKRIYAKPVLKPVPAPEPETEIAEVAPVTPTPAPASSAPAQAVAPAPAPAVASKEKEPAKAPAQAETVTPALPVDVAPPVPPSPPPAPAIAEPEDDTDKILAGKTILPVKTPQAAPEIPEIPEIPPAIRKNTPELPPLPNVPAKQPAAAVKPKAKTPAPQETSWYDKVTGYFSGDEEDVVVALPSVPEPAPVPLPDMPGKKEEIQIPAELKNLPAAPLAPEQPAPALPAMPAPLTEAPEMPASKEVANTPAMPALPPGKAPKTPPAEEKNLSVVTPAPASAPTPAPAVPAAEPAVPGLLYSVSFAPATKEISVADQKKIIEIGGQIKADKNKRLKIVSYATPENDQESSARRLSLQRAIAVRKVLLDQGIDSMQLNVQAMGNTATGGNKDRVDVVVIGE